MRKTQKQLAEIAAATPGTIPFKTLLDFIRADTDSTARAQKKFFDFLTSEIQRVQVCPLGEAELQRIAAMNLELFKRGGIGFGYVEKFKAWRKASTSLRRAAAAKVKHQYEAEAKAAAAKAKAADEEENREARKTKKRLTFIAPKSGLAVG